MVRNYAPKSVQSYSFKGGPIIDRLGGSLPVWNLFYLSVPEVDTGAIQEFPSKLATRLASLVKYTYDTSSEVKTIADFMCPSACGFVCRMMEVIPKKGDQASFDNFLWDHVPHDWRECITSRAMVADGIDISNFNPDSNVRVVDFRNRLRLKWV